MEVLVDFRNNFMLTSAGEVGELAQPLEKLGITYFSFVRAFPDGSHIRLCNNADWTEHYYTRQFYNIVLEQIPKFNGHILWSQVDRHPLFSDASELFNVDNGIVIVE